MCIIRYHEQVITHAFCSFGSNFEYCMIFKKNLNHCRLKTKMFYEVHYESQIMGLRDFKLFQLTYLYKIIYLYFKEKCVRRLQIC